MNNNFTFSLHLCMRESYVCLTYTPLQTIMTGLKCAVKLQLTVENQLFCHFSPSVLHEDLYPIAYCELKY